MEIRLASLEDAPALADLLGQLGYPTTPEALRGRLASLLDDAAYGTLLATRAGRPVGLIGLRLGRSHERDGLYGQIQALVVDDAERGQGVGAALLEAGEAWLAARGATAVLLTTRHDRHDAHRFYARHGYAPTGLRFVKSLPPPAPDAPGTST